MTRDKISKKIEKHQEAIENDSRDYIGASSIGSDCLRQIWYQFKGVKAQKVPTKFRRTWAIGKALEQVVHNWLVDVGIVVWRNYPELVHPTMPFFKGNVDGVWMKSRYKIHDQIPKAIIEIKTAKDASFKIFVKKGVKAWNPQYYAQVQAYMGLSGIHSTYILVLNKDNSDISDELVLFDPEFYKKLEEKAAFVYGANAEPPRIHGSALWYQCKMCKFNKVCHK
jgi:hypothetical protein